MENPLYANGFPYGRFRGFSYSDGKRTLTLGHQKFIIRRFIPNPKKNMSFFKKTAAAILASATAMQGSAFAADV